MFALEHVRLHRRLTRRHRAAMPPRAQVALGSLTVEYEKSKETVRSIRRFARPTHMVLGKLLPLLAMAQVFLGAFLCALARRDGTPSLTFFP